MYIYTYIYPHMYTHTYICPHMYTHKRIQKTYDSHVLNPTIAGKQGPYSHTYRPCRK